jgi:hypothetical protein
MIANLVYIVKTIELCASKWQNLWYVTYISIKKKSWCFTEEAGGFLDR